MYLKTLTLRGFKSFASATTLELEPGITCIVGPNGSGKSNVVDALAWVMGEQGAKSLRGGKMEDVVFAGTSGRAPLGRAEVALTIDNSDGALPIDYTEVTISRTMFRNGGSEYAINGSTCRLLDVQELLSDSGIGREMHVIVGQGQLDSILRATPEDRRGFIEEAAGVLKHRKRKEKALRKLEATEANLHRLTDLLAELRRQLKPLGRQAEVARRAAVIQADVRDARARVLADDVVSARATLEAETADEEALAARQAEVTAALEVARELEAALEATLRESLPQLARAQETWFDLSGLAERFRGLQSLAAERLRHAEDGAAQPVAGSGRSPEELEAEAERVEAEEQAIEARTAELSAELEASVTARTAAEAEAAAEDKRVADLQRAAADRREGLARLRGQVEVARTRARSAAEEAERLSGSREAALQRAERAQREFTALETQVAGLDAGEEDLDAEHEQAAARLAAVEEELAQVQTRTEQAERDRAALTARRDALETGLRRKDGAGALLELASDDPHEPGGPLGVRGSVAALLDVDAGYEAAVAAALGPAADAVVLASLAHVPPTLERLRVEDLGRADLLVAGAPSGSATATAREQAASGAVWALAHVNAPDDLTTAVAALLGDVLVVDDLDAASAWVAAASVDRPRRAVTREGDLLGAYAARGGTHDGSSLLEVQAAVDEAGERLADVVAETERLGFALTRLEHERATARAAVDVTLAQLHESDATLAAVAEELAQHGAAARNARSDAERAGAAIEAAQAAHSDALAAATALEERLATAEQAPAEEPETAERERLAEAAREARAAETQARLALRTVEEQAKSVLGRAAGLRRRAATEREQRARAEARRQRLRAEATTARGVQQACQKVLAALEVSLGAAAARRAEVQQSRASDEQALLDVRGRLRDLARDLDELRTDAHRDEMARAAHQMRLDQLAERAMTDLGLEVDALVADYGPDRPVPDLSVEVEDGADPPTYAFERAAQEKRLRQAERALSQLGRINPLALEEFTAMEERHAFLSEQLEDLRRTRADLADIVTQVDERVEQVFTEAYRDVQVAFDHVFARLFPGGEGRLVLTDPSSMLTTGVEVEARPPGKKVKRLSLLSGGERSLVAVAFLVALFKARPSPFYILDEVEAALDDTNLGRLLEIYEELREDSQLLVITHQKRTMEVGDALYGVTMRGDGVSTVISQRLRERQPA
ncbi:chromosome segregation protein SMC [Nocardioidaceae bacterium]|nr:chromosome segregation protein SMC [Nocardioidaceae bacterium]